MTPTGHDPVLDVNRDALLKEGARSYLEAYTAFTTFRNEVRSICQPAIKKFSLALAVPNQQAEAIVPCDTPEDEFNGSIAFVGVKQKISRRRNQGFVCVLSCGLSWVLGKERWFGCWVGVWFNQREMAERLHAGFQRSKETLPSEIALKVQKNEVWLARSLKPDDMASLSDHLDKVMVEWIRLWKEFGGLKAIAPEQT